MVPRRGEAVDAVLDVDLRQRAVGGRDREDRSPGGVRRGAEQGVPERPGAQAAAQALRPAVGDRPGEHAAGALARRVGQRAPVGIDDRLEAAPAARRVGEPRPSEGVVDGDAGRVGDGRHVGGRGVRARQAVDERGRLRGERPGPRRRAPAPGRRRRRRSAAGPRAVRARRSPARGPSPAASRRRARGAPKFDVLATSSRSGSRIAPSRVVAANSRLSWIGPPAWKLPTGLSAPAPGMPVASTRPVSWTSGTLAVARSRMERARVGGGGHGGARRAEAEGEDEGEAACRHQAPGAEAEQERARPEDADVRHPRLQPEARERDEEARAGDDVDVGDDLGVDEVRAADDRQRDEADEEERDRLARAALRRLRGDAGLATAPAPDEQQQQRREQEDAQELDDGRHVAADRRVRGARGDRLRGVRDRGARPQAEREGVEVERVADERQQEDGRRPEHRDRRDREGDLPLVRAHDGPGRGDRGVAAHRGADPDEHGDARGHAEPPSRERWRTRTPRRSSRARARTPPPRSPRSTRG